MVLSDSLGFVTTGPAAQGAGSQAGVPAGTSDVVRGGDTAEDRLARTGAGAGTLGLLALGLLGCLLGANAIRRGGRSVRQD